MSGTDPASPDAHDPQNNMPTVAAPPATPRQPETVDEKAGTPLPAAPTTDASTEGRGGGATPAQIDDYDILSEIAHGGMGVVYRARQRSLDRIVALKMIRAGEFANPADVQRFLAEAEAAARLDHPHIVPVYQVGGHDGQPFFSMKLVEGGHLGQQVQRFGADPRGLARVMIPVARAVHHAHQRGILHRDLKPGNILIDADGQPLVTDFGLAKRIEAGAGMTISGAIVGTPEYMAPEQARAQKVLTTAVDVYGLGATFYAMLAGRAPCSGDNLLDTLHRVVHEDPAPPSRFNAAVPRDLEVICLKCLEKAPARRYGSAEELAADLERWLANEPILARPVGRAERAVKWAHRHPALAALAGVVTLAVLVLFVVISSFSLVLAERNRDLESQRETLKEQGEELRTTNAQLTITIGQLEETGRELVSQTNKANDAAQKARDEAQRAKQNEDLANDRAVVARRGEFAAHLSRVSLLAERQPQQAIAMLDDPRSSPPELRDFTWGLIHATSDRSLYTVRSAPATGAASPLPRDPDADDVAGEVVFLSDQVLVTISPGPRSGQRVRRFDAANGQMRGELQIDGPATFSEDRKTVAQVGPDRTLRRWDLLRTASAGERTLEGPGTPQLSTFDDNLGTLAAVDENGQVRIWDATSGRLRHALPVAENQVTNLRFTPRGHLLVFERDPESPCFRVVSLWDTATGQRLLRLDGTVPAVQQMAVSADGRLLAVCSEHPGGVTVHDLTTGKAIRVPAFDVHETNLLSFGPRGQTLIHLQREEGRMAGDPYSRLRLFDLGGSEARLVQIVGLVKMSSFILSRDHGRIALNYLDGQVLLDTLTGRPVLPQESAVAKFKALGFSPDGQVMITSDSRLWELPRGKELLSLRGRGPIAFSPDGRLLATQTDANVFTVWNIESELPYARPLPWNLPVLSLALTADGSSAAVLGGEIGGFPAIRAPVARLFDVETGLTRATLSEGDRAGIGNLAIASDGRGFGIDRGWLLSLWDGDGGLRRHVEVPNGFERILFLPNGREVALGGQSAVLFYGRDGKPVGKLDGPEPLGSALAMSADGAIFAAGTPTGRAVVWDRATGQRKVSPYQHKGAVRGVALSPDGKRAASAGIDGLVRVWDLEKGTHLEVPGHVGSVNVVAFCGDGRTLCSGGEDRTVRFWDPLTGQLRASFRRHNFPITCMAVSQDGRTLLTGSEGKPRGGEVLVWRSIGISAVAVHGSDRGSFRDADGILQAAFSPDGASLVTLARTGRLARWDLATGAPLAQPGRPPFTLERLPQNVTYLTLDLDEADRAVLHYRRSANPGTGAETLFRWHERDGEKALHALPGSPFPVPGGRRTVSAPEANLSALLMEPRTVSTGRLSVWGVDLKTGKRTAILEDVAGRWLAETPNGRWVALETVEGEGEALQRSVTLVDVEKRAVAWKKPVPKQQQVFAHFPPDGRSVQVGTVGLFALETGKELPAAEKQAPRPVTSPNGKITLTVPPGAKPDGPALPIEVRETDGGKLLGVIRPRRALTQVHFSHDSKVIFGEDSNFQYREVLAWEIATGRETRFAGSSGGMLIEPGSNLAKFPRRFRTVVPVNDHHVLVVWEYRGMSLWDWTTGLERTDIHLPRVDERALQFTPDHKLLLVHAEGTCQVWDTATWKTRKVLAGRSGSILGLSLSPDGKTLTLLEPSAARRWDLATMKEGPAVKVNLPTTMSPGERMLLPLGTDSLVRVETKQARSADRRSITICSGQPAAERYHHDGEVEALALAANGKWAASAGRDHVIHLWDPATGKPLGQLAGHTSAVYFLEFLPGTDLLLSAGDDETVRVWDVAAKAERGRLRGQADRVRAVAVSRDGRLLATAGEGTVHLWDVGDLRLRATYRGHQGPVVSLAFARDGARLASVGSDGVARVWGVAAREAPQVAEGEREGWTRPVVLSADGKTLFVGEKDGTVAAVETATKARRPFAARHNGPVTALALSPDGSTLASGGADGLGRLLDTATGKEVASWDGPGGAVAALVFSPDGTRLAAGAGRPPGLFAARRPSRIAILDLKTKQALALDGHADGIRALAFSPDGKVLASAGLDTAARLWNAEQGGEIRQLRHGGPVLSLAYAADGRLLTGTLDPTIHWNDQFGANCWISPLHVWDGKTGNYLGGLPVGGDIVGDLSVSGDLLAIAERSGAVSVWDLRRNHGQFLVRAHPERVERVVLSRDGTTLLTTGADGLARLWNVAEQRGRELLPNPADGAFGGVTLSRRGDLALVVDEGRQGARLRLYETATGKERAGMPIDPKPLAPGWLSSVVIGSVTPHGAGIAVQTRHPLDLRLSADLHPFERGDRPVDPGRGFLGEGGDHLVDVARPPLPFLGPHPGRYLVALGPDGAWAATAPRVMPPTPSASDPNPQPRIPAEMEVRLWNLKEGKAGPVLRGHKGRVSALAFSPDGKLLACCGDDRAVRLWHVDSGERAQLLEGHDRPVRSVCFSPDGAWLASGDEGQVLRLWQVRTGKEAAVLKPEAANPVRQPGRPEAEQTPASAAFTPDGKALIVAAADRRGGTQFKQWATRIDGDRVVLEPGRELARLPYPAMLDNFDTRGGTLFVAANHLLFALDVERGSWLGQVSVRQGLAASGSLAAVLNQEQQGRWVAFAVRIDVRSGDVKSESFTGLIPGTPTRPALSGDGKMAMTVRRSAEGDGAAAVWTMEPPPRGTLPATVKPLHTIADPPAAGMVSLSPDGSTAALATRDGKVILIAPATGKRLLAVEPAVPVTALLFSSDGTLLAGAENSEEGSVRLWEVKSGKEKLRLRAGSKPVRALTFSTDGARLGTGSADGMVSVWLLSDGRQVNAWRAHEGPVTALAFGADGKVLASGSADGTTAVTDVATAQAKLKPRPYRSGVNALALSADGQLLAVGVEAGMQVLDAVRGTPVQTMPLGAVHAVQFDAAGKELLFSLNRVAPSDWKGTIWVNDSPSAFRPHGEISLERGP